MAEEIVIKVDIEDGSGSSGMRKLKSDLEAAKKEIDDLKKKLSELHPEKNAAGFAELGQKITEGLKSVRSVIELFGAGSKDLNRVIKDLETSVSLFQRVQEISKKSKEIGDLAKRLLGIKNITAATNQQTSAIEAQAGAQEAANVATEGGSVAFKGLKAAIAATGIGILLILIGEIINNWDKLKSAFLNAFPQLKSAGKEFEDTWSGVKGAIFGSIGAIFHAVVQSVKSYIEVYKIGWQAIKQIVSHPFSAGEALSQAWDALKKEGGKLVDSWKAVGKAAVEGYKKGVQQAEEERRRAELNVLIEDQKRRLNVLETSGKDTYALKRKILQEELSLLEKGGKDYLEKLNEIEVLDAQHKQELHEKAVQAIKDKYSREIAEAQAAGMDTYDLERESLEKQLSLVKINSKEWLDLKSQIRILDLKYDKEYYDQLKKNQEDYDNRTDEEFQETIHNLDEFYNKQNLALLQSLKEGKITQGQYDEEEKKIQLDKISKYITAYKDYKKDISGLLIQQA